MIRAIQPFSIEFKPLIDEITDKERALRELAHSATMVKIIGKHYPEAWRRQFLPNGFVRFP